jgi:Tol biopolymer transport system component
MSTGIGIQPTVIANPPTVAPQLPGAAGRLVVSEDSGFTLRSIDPAGGDTPFAGPSAARVRGWSPDGRSVLLTREQTATLELILADGDGANPRSAGMLPFVPNQFSLAWSADGAQLAVAAGIRPQDASADRSSTIYLLDRAGASMAELISVRWMGDTLAWAPDGRGLAYYSLGNVQVLELPNGQPRDFGDSFHHDKLAWGADGRLYMFACEANLDAMCSVNPFTESAMAPIPGMTYRKIIHSKTADSESASVEVYAIQGESPDKAWLMLKSWMTGTLVLYNTATNTAETVYVPDANDSDRYNWSVWSPDGRYVTFERESNPLTYVYRPGAHEVPAPLISSHIEAWVR